MEFQPWKVELILGPPLGYFESPYVSSFERWWEKEPRKLQVAGLLHHGSLADIAISTASQMEEPVPSAEFPLDQGSVEPGVTGFHEPYLLLEEIIACPARVGTQKHNSSVA